MTPPVLVGSASRDLTAEDPRGWRLGGPATYAGLTLARLGLRPRVLLGVDAEAAGAEELDWLRAAGADLRLVRLGAGPVFENHERPDGRVQISGGPGDQIAVGLPDGWEAASAWLLLPVAGELPDAWAEVPAPSAFVGLGWQGLLRKLPPGGVVQRRRPAPCPLLARADLVVVSRFDVEPETRIDEMLGLLRRPATLVLTDGEDGGLIAERDVAGAAHLRRYPAIAARRVVDQTGAGDVFLAALAAARLGRSAVGSGRNGAEIRFAAAVASLSVEAAGLAGIPTVAAVVARLSSSTGPPPGG
jgi:sugar/nucleoside kinase (ribokinase family)